MSGQRLFFVVLFIWVGFYIYLFVFHNTKVSERLQEKRSKYIMLAFVLAGMCGAVLVDGSSKEAFLMHFNWYRYLGILMMIFAVIVRYFVVRQLGPAFAIDVGALPDQKLHTGGLFRLIRHPAYASEILGFLGVALVFNYPLSSLLAFFLPTTGVIYRIIIEERNLLRIFGEQYREYSAKTWRLIPYVF